MFKRYIKLINGKIKNLKDNIKTEKKNIKDIGIFSKLGVPNKIKNNKIPKSRPFSNVNTSMKDNQIFHMKKINEELYSKFSGKYKEENLKNNLKLMNDEEPQDNTNKNSKNNLGCQKILSCGHKCLGVNKEIICPPCLDKKCNNYGGINLQDTESVCYLCLKKLNTSPIVCLSCNHYLHYLCIQNKINRGVNLYGQKLNFNFIKCEFCHILFDCPFLPDIHNKIEYYKTIYKQTQEKIKERIAIEKLAPNKKNYDLFTFFLCYKCHKPYYVGKNNNKKENFFLLKYKNIEKDCLCGKDSFIYDEMNDKTCKKHGIEYVEYKCKYCCNMASRFQSQTHLCEKCYFIDKSIKECNKQLCEFGGKHPPNGVEYCLGCFACKLEKDKNKN
jgi:E3 ubiquitin-protein ligase MYCBP2